uniref:Agenet domain-containing protein n=1 Tax=Loa loa TaxID=7209 RepID=A0A1I7VVV0_LOALO
MSKKLGFVGPRETYFYVSHDWYDSGCIMVYDRMEIMLELPCPLPSGMLESVQTNEIGECWEITVILLSKDIVTFVF